MALSYNHACAVLDKTLQESSSRREIAQLYDWEAQVQEMEHDRQILAQTRFIVARTSGLQALGTLDERVCKRLRVGQRLRHIDFAHARLQELLSNQEAIETLVEERAAYRPPAEQPPAN